MLNAGLGVGGVGGVGGVSGTGLSQPMPQQQPPPAQTMSVTETGGRRTVDM